MADPRQESRANRSTATIVGALIAVALGVAIVVRASRPSEPASEPAITTIDIVSDPAGATVVRADGGGLIGVTPFTVTFPKSDTDLPVIVTREGYQERHLTVPLFSKTGRIDVMMTAIGVDAGPGPKPPPDGWMP